VRNVGTTDAGPFDVEINGTTTRVSGLSSGEEADATVEFSSGPVGGILAEADSTHLVAESDEGNNEFHIVFTPPPRCTPEAVTDTPVTTPASPTTSPTPSPPGDTSLPDLVILYHVVSYTGACPWGGPGEIRVRVRNVGTTDAGPFDVEINGTTTRVSGLVSGEEVDATVAFSSGPVGGILAEADSTHLVAESDEGNNEFHIVFTPPPHCTPEGD
jgi:subtilase family serine protease